MTRLRLAVPVLLAAVAVGLLASPGAASAAPRDVVQPHLPRLGKEPEVAHLRRFLHRLRARDHASAPALRRLIRRKRHLGSEAKDVLAARDRKRQRYLRSYLAHHHRHRRRIAKTSRDYYAFLRSKEWHRVRQMLAQASDEIDRLQNDG